MSNFQRFFRYLFSRTFIIQLVLIVFASAGILYGTLAYLDYFTLHGQEITVPDLIGLPKEDLKETLEEKTLQFIILDSVYVEGEDKGIVVAQNPKSLSKVKKNRTIYITINAQNPPSVKLPLVIDKSLRQATSVLENTGLVLGELIYVPDQCVNCVLGQMVNGFEQLSDTIVPKGTVVDLVLGGGLSDEKILVPLIINLGRDDAIAKLKASYLNIGAELYDGSIYDDEDSSNAKIFAQHPRYSSQSWVYMGSTIDVEYTMIGNKIDTNIVILDSSYIIPFEKDTE